MNNVKDTIARATARGATLRDIFEIVARCYARAEDALADAEGAGAPTAALRANRDALKDLVGATFFAAVRPL